MECTNKYTINKFGKKMKELCDVVAGDPNWRNYVEAGTIQLIEDLFIMQNLTVVGNKYDMPYGSLRAKYIAALRRIKNKETTKIRNGKSDKAKKLLILLEFPEWEVPLTDREIQYAKLFKEHKNFYEVARILDVKACNIAGSLYGTSQRKGVIEKIENYINQTK